MLSTMLVIPKDPTLRIGLALAAVTVAVIGVFVTVFALHYVVAVPQLKQFVDIGGEANLPTWWNASMLFMVGIGALTARSLQPDRAGRRAWLVVALAAVLLSLDEIASLHERLATPVRAAGIDVPTYAWLVPGVVLALIGGAVLVVVGRALSRPTQHILGVALLLYGAGAVGLEAVNGWLREHNLDLLFAAGTTVEETLEMTACILAVMGTVNTIQRRRATGSASFSTR